MLEALRICTDLLAPKGTFVTKVFRSGDYSALLFAFNQLFERVDATKPVASRNESTEIFVVCRGYKAPKKVDARLLDHRTLFQKDDEPMPNPDVFSNSKQKRCVGALFGCGGVSHGKVVRDEGAAETF